MTKQQWKKLLTEATKVSKESDRIDDAFKKFCDVVNPSSYPIWLESGCLWGFMRAVEAIYDKDVYEHVSYWVYEVLPSKNKVLECTYKGKTYNAKNMNEYIDWILAQE
jgi:hypothetical protein